MMSAADASDGVACDRNDCSLLQSEKAAADSASAPRETTTTCRRVANTLRKDLVLLFTVVGIVVGFTIGLAIRPANPSKDVLMWIGTDFVLNLIRSAAFPRSVGFRFGAVVRASQNKMVTI